MGHIEDELDLIDFIKNNLEFSKKWESKSTENKYVQNVLNHASKRDTGYHGEPDLIYCNDNNQLLILLENKPSVKYHVGDKKNPQPTKYAVDGIKKYLSFFMHDMLDISSENLKNWKIIGIAFSGDIFDEYNHRIDTYYVENNKLINANIHILLNESDYISLFNNNDLEEITLKVSKASKEINQKLRDIDTNNRSVLISALMIALFGKDEDAFKYKYKNLSPSDINALLPKEVEKTLKNEEVNTDKIEILKNKLSFLDDNELKNNNIIKDILDELNDNIIPLFEKKTNYDIIGKFYSEFLRYAGVTDVKKGIVLTPHHITALFADLLDELLDIGPKDIIFDPGCGTGSFLIAGMNKIDNIIEKSQLPNKKDKEEHFRKEQLLGFEKNTTMFILAMSNMLFRGDGKSNIFNIDFFSDEAIDILKKVKPTIGFINPPYAGKDNEKNPTKKEIQFLERMLDNVSKYGIIIAPMSTYFQNNDIRNRILDKHTLKYVIHMPNELFSPNASTHTAIAVFETHNPHQNKEVIFYDLKDDGFVLSKNKGRTDKYNKWESIREDLLKKLKNPDEYSDKNLLKTRINKGDEWVIYDYIETDYDNLSESDFIHSIKDNIIFNLKKDLNLLEEDIDEITLLEILNQNIE
ncbi:MAG: N-6 DNA methylase [Methanobrevibacter sp.]|uniref:HsdM family class I SAM-dependent methyltransferase n=1 Tax=Methanobrevibacter sp. TaxID=66852 RepID=UPI002E76616C|nr:N-6 DNA methylase [Methanobrevibacter sp.]MEE0936074.1 N-6 DNA methylase [Methanobrevibacter sp.]